MPFSVGEKINYDDGSVKDLFNHLLSSTKARLESRPAISHKPDFWKSFEVDVYEALQSSSSDLGINWKIEYISGHRFPDIVARINEKEALGIEVKTISTKNASWKIMGGSIMESTRIPDVSRIHIFCAKQSPFEIKYKPFEDCVENVAVTHSPRYMLNMDLTPAENLFQKLHKSYDDIRQMTNPFDAFKDYMIKSRAPSQSETDDSQLWWFSPNEKEFSKQELAEQSFANALVNSQLRFWNKLAPEEKEKIKIQMVVATPSILEGRYENTCQWLLQHQGVINPSFRDSFSAGGQVVVKGVKVPKIIGNIDTWKTSIAEEFNRKEFPQESFEDWRSRVESIKKFSQAEKKVLGEILKEIGMKVIH